jgi:hypothetical protein
MKTKLLSLAVVLLACSSLSSARLAHAAGQGPEDVVRDFYMWSLPLQENSPLSPLDSEDVYKYVHHGTVSNLRIKYAMYMLDWIYFLCAQEIDPQLLTDLEVHKAVPVTDTLSLVAVGVKGKKPYLLAFVQKEKEGWRITKIENALGNLF